MRTTVTLDADTAALVELEHHATVITDDPDVGRFRGVRWRTP